MPYRFNPLPRRFDRVETGSTPIGPLNTLSAENGAPTNPSGNNFNFTGSTGGGATSNGAILFSTPANGQMDGVVQTDNITITINASNQLQVLDSLVWQIIQNAQTAQFGAGYFINVGHNPTLTLPATATIGQTFAAYALSGSTWTLKCHPTQQIQVNDVITSLGGTVTSTQTGDFIFIKAVTATSFVAIPFSGNFETT